MINGDINLFKNNLYYGDEFELDYNNKQYFVQSYNMENSAHAIEFCQWKPFINKVLYKITSTNKQDNIEKFLNEKLFDGKSFYEVENQIEWLDIGTIITPDN